MFRSNANPEIKMADSKALIVQGGQVQWSPAMTEAHRDLAGLTPFIERALPANMTPERFGLMIMSAIERNPYLLECDRGTLLLAGKTAANLRMMPDGIGRQGHLVPFKGRVQFLPGYGGYIHHAANAGGTMIGRIVCEADDFDYEETESGPRMRHRPALGSNRGALIGAFARLTAYSRPPQVHYCTLEDIHTSRGRSAQYQRFLRGQTPKHRCLWETEYLAMAAKTPIRLMAKQTPMMEDIACDLVRPGLVDQHHDLGHMATVDDRGDVQVHEIKDAVDPSHGQALAALVGGSDDGPIEVEADDGAPLMLNQDGETLFPLREANGELCQRTVEGLGQMGLHRNIQAWAKGYRILLDECQGAEMLQALRARNRPTLTAAVKQNPSARQFCAMLWNAQPALSEEGS